MKTDFEELTEHARFIWNWKESRPESERMTYNKLLQLFPALGSDKTLLSFMGGHAKDRNIKRWLPNYRQVREQIESGLTPQAEDEILLLSNVRTVSPIVNETVARKPGIDRLVVIEGTSGAGKTWALRKIYQELTGAVYLMEANDTWRSARVAAGDMLRALGEKSIPSSMADRQNALLGKLQKKIVLLIDEGHHGGAGFLSLIKTILNRSQAIVVLAAMDTLWRKLTHESSEEARQLLHNRLAERVYLKPPTREDVLTYFGDMGVVTPQSAAYLIKESASHGYLSFLRRVRDMALAIAKPGDDIDEILPDAIREAKNQMGVTA